MTRRELYTAIALALAVLALWAACTAAFTVRVMQAGNVNAGIEYEWKGERV
jgi:hypothetical protein